MNVKLRTQIFLCDMCSEEYLDSVMLSRYSISEHNNDSSYTGALFSLRETSLAAGQIDRFRFERDAQLLILPLVGKLHIKRANSLQKSEVGEMRLLSLPAGDTCDILNNYQSSDIHYLIVAFSTNKSLEAYAGFSLMGNKLKTVFRNIASEGMRKTAIGKFSGRTEAVYRPSSAYTFAWVVQGAFEVEDCLLEKSDGLALVGEKPIEFEALSNEAIIIFMESSPKESAY